MAESVVVADNVELVANNISDKVGGSLVGMKNLAQESSGIISEPVLGVLDNIRTLQTSAVDKLSEMVDIFKSHFGFVEREADSDRRAEQSGDQKPKGQGDLAKLADWWQNLDMKKDMEGMGMAHMAAGMVRILGKAIFSSVTFFIGSLIWTVFDAFAGMKMWGGPAGFVGGLLGGLSKGLIGAAMQGSKFAVLGGTIGMMFGGPFGMIAGVALGGIFGALMGYIGGERIAKTIQKMIDFPKMMFDKILEVFSNMKTWVVDTTVGIAEKVSDLAKTIFTPIIDTYKKMFNLIKTALNWVIDQIPDFGFDKLKEMKEAMKFDMTPLSTDHEIGYEANDLNRATGSAISDAQSGKQIESERVAEIIADADKLIENMDTKRLKEDSDYSRIVLREINKSVDNLAQLASTGKVSEEDAKKLIAKAKDLRSQLDKNAKEASEKIKLANEKTDFQKTVFETPDVELSTGKVESGEIRDKLLELEEQKEVQLAKIKELELKVAEGPKGRRGSPHAKQLAIQKGKLSKTEDDIDTIVAFIKEYKLQIEPITTDLDSLITAKHMQKKHLIQEDKKDTSQAAYIDQSSSPAIHAGNKTINTIAAKTVFPVDPSLMAALAGYSK